MAQQEVLLGWLQTADADLDEQALAMLRRQLAGIIADLPELLRRYLDKIGSAVVEARVAKGGRTETVDEQERAELEGAAPTGPPAPGRPDQQAAQHTARPRQPGPDYAQEHAL